MGRDKSVQTDSDTSIAVYGNGDLIKAASSELKELLDRAFTNLKSVAPLKEEDPPPRLFFPHGIELIFVKLTVGLPEKPVITVEVKIAGEKGVKPEAIESAAEVNEQLEATGRSEQ